MRALFMLLLLVSACTPQTSAQASEPVDAARLYQRQCAVCHGATGAGDGPSAGINRPANLREIAPETSDEQLSTVIREGRGLMPPWGHLPDREIEALVRYVRRLAEERTHPAGE